jgi:hypothetical protein
MFLSEAHCITQSIIVARKDCSIVKVTLMSGKSYTSNASRTALPYSIVNA